MRSRLPGPLLSALEIREPLRGTALHSTVSKLVQFYHLQFEMVFPPLNFPLMIFKHMKNLGLPSKISIKTLRFLIHMYLTELVEIYPAVRRLATMLGIEFTYLISEKTRQLEISHPEIQLMSLIVVATKLSHPFDDVVRHPEGEFDPTTTKIDWSKWQEMMIDKPQEGFKRGEEIHVGDTDVASMSEKQMDDYLDWYQRTWVDDTEPKSMLCYSHFYHNE